jgi:hypothetical protein
MPRPFSRPAPAVRAALFLLSVLGAALAAPPTSLAAQEPGTPQPGARDFTWAGRVPAGRWLRVRDLNGSIRVEAADGDRAEVTAVKHGRHGLEDVRVVTSTIGEGGQDVLICALWGERATCDEDGSHSPGNVRNNDVTVDFTVRLPRGVKAAMSTVNGSVRVAGATAAVEAETVNGEVDAVSAGGPVTATTVNGDVRASMGTLGEGDVHYETVNGSVVVELPASVDAEVEMSTVNGRLDSDFPLTLRAGTRLDPHHMRATLGRGGRRLTFETVNGSVTLRKRG